MNFTSLSLVFCLLQFTGQKERTGELKSILQKRYLQLDSAMRRNSYPAAKQWVIDNITEDFRYVSKDKNVYDRAGFIKGIHDQMAATKQVAASTTKITTVHRTGSVIKAEVDSVSDALMTFDGKVLRLTDKSHTVDTWVQKGKNLRLLTSVQTQSGTQMFEKDH